MVGIICDPANVVRMFVQDVDRNVGKIFIDDGRFTERVHVLVKFCLVRREEAIFLWEVEDP